jgi:hypothetical protein
MYKRLGALTGGQRRMKKADHKTTHKGDDMFTMFTERT